MKYILLLLILTGCAADTITTDHKGNNVEVSLLFEYDSIRVYRFMDGGNYHYFTKDMTISTYSCGKGCTRQEIISTTHGR